MVVSRRFDLQQDHGVRLNRLSHTTKAISSKCLADKFCSTFAARRSGETSLRAQKGGSLLRRRQRGWV